MRYTFSALSDRNFRYLWFGLVAMMCGTQMQSIARGFLVYELTGSAMIVGLISAASAVPILVLSLFGGAYADRIDRKRLIQIGQAISTVLAIFVAVSISTESLTWYHLLATSILQGVMWSFLAPARLAIIPEMVGKRLLSSAIALYGAGFSVTILVAPAIGGLLYVLIGPEGVYYVIAALGLTAVTLTNPITGSLQEGRGARPPIMDDIKAGLAYIRGDSVVVVLLVIATLTYLLAMPFKFLLPVFIAEVYYQEAGAFGVLISMIGLGSLAGSLVFASLGKWRRGLMLIAGSFASAIALILVAAVPLYYAGIGIMVLLGLGDAGRRVLNQALIMEQVEDEYQGRVMSVFTMLFGFMPLGILPAGLAMDVLGGRTTVLILGLAMFAATTVLLVTQKRLRVLQ